jgi:hypothetical protein
VAAGYLRTWGCFLGVFTLAAILQSVELFFGSLGLGLLSWIMILLRQRELSDVASLCGFALFFGSFATCGVFLGLVAIAGILGGLMTLPWWRASRARAAELLANELEPRIQA